MYIYIYMLLCSISGRFFWGGGSRMRFFFSWRTNVRKSPKNVFSPVKTTHLWAPKQRHLHLGLSSNAFKNGALTLRNISTPLLNGHARAILECFNSPSFHALFLKPQNPWNPYFCSVSWRFCGCFWPPPPKPTTRICSPHNRITAKVRFVNKVGALLVFKKRSWNPYFIAFRAPKLKTL